MSAAPSLLLGGLSGGQHTPAEVMPYGGTTPAQDARIERCVAHLMAQGKDKVAAIRICKAAILEADRRSGK